MVVKPAVRGFICLTAHPFGCAANVREQISYIKSQPRTALPVKNALIIGSSTGYGLASAITALFGCGAMTLGFAFEKNTVRERTATAGLYNTAALNYEAAASGLWSKTLIGDAFSDAAKEVAAGIISREMGGIDLLIYSIAAPSRIDPVDGVKYTSCIKPIGADCELRGLDMAAGTLTRSAIAAATEEEIASTVKVMGGEDLELWVRFLSGRGLLAEGCKVVSYSYTGPEVTHPIYKNGTIGRAKEHLRQTSDRLAADKSLGVHPFVSLNKAVVTQASAAIPTISLYVSILFRIMKEKGLHEGCVEQLYRLFNRLAEPCPAASDGYIHMDDWEMLSEVQGPLMELWDKVDDGNIASLTDIAGYKADFLRLFGFGLDGVDYEADVEVAVDETANNIITL